MTSDPGPARQPNPVLPALVARRGWPRPRHIARRWRLGDRFHAGRIDGRRHPGALTFRHEGRTVRLTSSRLTLRPLTYAPQFHWVLHQATSPPRIDNGRIPGLTEPGATRTHIIIAAPTAGAKPSPAIGHAPRAIPGRVPAFTPVARVVSSRAMTPGEPALRRITKSVLEDVVRHHRRIETWNGTSTVMRAQPTTVAVAERAPASDSRQLAESPEQSPPGSIRPAGHEYVAPTFEDLDRLTDRIVTRIDERLTAQRERMGRVF